MCENSDGLQWSFSQNRFTRKKHRYFIPLFGIKTSYVKGIAEYHWWYNLLYFRIVWCSQSQGNTHLCWNISSHQAPLFHYTNYCIREHSFPRWDDSNTAIVICLFISTVLPMISTIYHSSFRYVSKFGLVDISIGNDSPTLPEFGACAEISTATLSKTAPHPVPWQKQLPFLTATWIVGQSMLNFTKISRPILF